LAEERLKRIPGDTDAMRALVWGATSRGDYSKAYILSRNILDEGKAEPQDLNENAWLSLFIGKVEPNDIDNALKGAQLTKQNPAVLHTLGCLYAQVGKTKEAREILVHSMDLLNLDEPNPDYWYAFGLIAEHYGDGDAARANYMRVTQPKRSVEIPGSTYYLAQARLQALHAQKQ